MSIFSDLAGMVSKATNLINNGIGFFDDIVGGLRGISGIFKDDIAPEWANSFKASGELNAMKRDQALVIAKKEFDALKRGSRKKAAA
jgi:hypothetical protein